MSSPNWLAVLLLAAMIAIPLAGQDGSLMMEPARPAACHQHDGGAPASQPVSYRCCQSGHDSAILQDSPTSQLDSADLGTPFEWTDIFAPPSKVQIVRQVATSSADPPNLTPLRI
jgi:hypothetical protein